jgi:hypothetical protein
MTRGEKEEEERSQMDFFSLFKPSIPEQQKHSAETQEERSQMEFSSLTNKIPIV